MWAASKSVIPMGATVEGSSISAYRISATANYSSLKAILKILRFQSKMLNDSITAVQQGHDFMMFLCLILIIKHKLATFQL